MMPRRLRTMSCKKVDAAGVPMSIAVAYGAKGAAIESKDPAAALAAYEHGVDVARKAGARFMETLIAPRIAALHARSGEPSVALRGFERMLDSFGEATDIASVSTWRASLAVLLAKLGHFEAAATLHGTYSQRDRRLRGRPRDLRRHREGPRGVRRQGLHGGRRSGRLDVAAGSVQLRQRAGPAGTRKARGVGPGLRRFFQLHIQNGRTS